MDIGIVVRDYEFLFTPVPITTNDLLDAIQTLSATIQGTSYKIYTVYCLKKVSREF